MRTLIVLASIVIYGWMLFWAIYTAQAVDEKGVPVEELKTFKTLKEDIKKLWFKLDSNIRLTIMLILFFSLVFLIIDLLL